MTITDTFVRMKIRNKLKEIDAAFTQAKNKLVEILVHPDSTNEQITEAVACIRTLDAGIKAIRVKAQQAFGNKGVDRL